MLLLPRILTVMMKFLFCVSHAILPCFLVMVMLQFLSCAPVLLTFPPPPPLLSFALKLPRRLAAVADALSGMLKTDLLLLFLLHEGAMGQRRLGPHLLAESRVPVEP
jgi:hypothetical protein